MADVIVVGAGAAGLMAGKLLAQQGLQVLVLEARDRIGGRICTLDKNEWGYAAEAGAEFIHGKLDVTLDLLKEAGLKKTEIKGDMWSVFNGEWSRDSAMFEDQKKVIKKLKSLQKDVSISVFLNSEFPGEEFSDLRQSISGYVEGYYAGDPANTSSKAFLAQWESEDEEQFRPADGYTTLLEYLKDCIAQNGGEISLGTVVKKVQWQKGKVDVTDSFGNVYSAEKAVITIPLGVWRAPENDLGSIGFTPSLPAKIEAAHQLGFGSALKILLQFTKPFWQEAPGKKNIGFIFSDEAIGTWWLQNPLQTNTLTGWVAGPKAAKLSTQSESDLQALAIASLANIFSTSTQILQDDLLQCNVFNWANEPFTRGAYAYSTVLTTTACKVMIEPVEQTLFFAGEALYDGTEMGTVEAALTSGKRAAESIISVVT